MTSTEYIEQPQSTKIALVEVDAPLSGYRWLNHQPGVWYIQVSPGSQTFVDDFGNTGYWGPVNDQYYNIQSLNVAGVLYSEVASIAAVVATEKTWFYDTATTNLYVRFDDWRPPESFVIVAPGAAIGFTNETADTSYYEDIYYEPLVQSIPNISKKRDALFFGVLQFQGGSITFNNANGYFDNFANLDLYGQPVRIKLSFEGLPFDEAVTIYTAKVKDFKQNLTSFTLNVLDIRKLLSRDLPINVFNSTDHPNMDSKYYGYPIPIAFGSIVQSPAYRTSAGNFTFLDTSLNNVDSGIVVYNKEDAITTHAGTETDGTFTITEGTAEGAKTNSAGYAAGVTTVNIAAEGTGTILVGDKVKIGSDKTIYTITSGDVDVSNGGSISFTPGLVEAIGASETNVKVILSEYTVTFSQTTTTNGLEVIEQILDEYENIAYNALNYDQDEWSSEKTNAYDLSLWIGKGNVKSTVDVIEEVCNANQGIFDVLADGKFTFRTYSENRVPTHEIKEGELLQDPEIERDSDEFRSSIVIGYSKNYKTKEYQEYNNKDFQSEVYGRYRQYQSKPNPVNLSLGNETDAIAVSNTIMNRSKFIYPKVTLDTKIQNIQTRIMDNTLYDCVRQDGSQVVARSLYENIGINVNVSTYEMTIDMRQAKETNDTYKIILGRAPDEDIDYYDGGTPTSRPTNIIQGRRI